MKKKNDEEIFLCRAFRQLDRRRNELFRSPPVYKTRETFATVIIIIIVEQGTSKLKKKKLESLCKLNIGQIEIFTKERRSAIYAMNTHKVLAQTIYALIAIAIFTKKKTFRNDCECSSH